MCPPLADICAPPIDEQCTSTIHSRACNLGPFAPAIGKLVMRRTLAPLQPGPSHGALTSRVGLGMDQRKERTIAESLRPRPTCCPRIGPSIPVVGRGTPLRWVWSSAARRARCRGNRPGQRSQPARRLCPRARRTLAVRSLAVRLARPWPAGGFLGSGGRKGRGEAPKTARRRRVCAAGLAAQRVPRSQRQPGPSQTGPAGLAAAVVGARGSCTPPESGSAPAAVAGVVGGARISHEAGNGVRQRFGAVARVALRLSVGRRGLAVPPQAPPRPPR
jgi:hypothetical protein